MEALVTLFVSGSRESVLMFRPTDNSHWDYPSGFSEPKTHSNSSPLNPNRFRLRSISEYQRWLDSTDAMSKHPSSQLCPISTTLNLQSFPGG